MWKSLRCNQLCATSWTVAHKAPLFMGILRQEIWVDPYATAAAAKSLQLCLTLWDPIDGSPPGPAVPGILQARTLEWVAISFSNAGKWKVKVAQSCPTLSNPMDCSLPGSSLHGIFQARVLEWGAIAFSKIHICVCVYIYMGEEHFSKSGQSIQRAWYMMVLGRLKKKKDHCHGFSRVLQERSEN